MIAAWHPRTRTVTALYVLAAIVMTWPLVTVIGTNIAGDLGDSVFIGWVLMWTGGQVLRALHGDVSALAQYWQGNIFYPERLTIAYSEHFTGQLLQILPLYAATGNVVLCYNVLLLSTIVLSGLAVYLLVRDLTDQPLAAFVAGLAFAFAPYRAAQPSHLQVLSSCWMPLAILGLRRFFVTGRTRPLVGAAAALTLQNLSCGYYMVFFGPFAAFYCLYEMAHRRLLRSWRVWRGLLVAAFAVALCTWPFVSPYLMVREVTTMGVRPFEEVLQFSADTHAYATAPEELRLWGERLRAYPLPEGDGFQGFTIMLFGLAGLIAGCVAAGTAAAHAGRASPMRPWQQVVAGLLGVMLIAGTATWFVLSVVGPFGIPVGADHVLVRNGALLLMGLAVLLAAMVLLVPAARHFVRGSPGSAFGFFSWSLVAAALLSLGPRMHAGGLSIGNGPYLWLYAHVPGFDGLRVPARFLMLVALFLAVLAGYGAAALITRWHRPGSAAVLVAAVCILAESWVAPFSTNVPLGVDDYASPPAHLRIGANISPLYTLVARMPPGTVLIEFPFGEPAYELQAMFYAGSHRKPLVNGYSGFFPQSYRQRLPDLWRLPLDRDKALIALKNSGATHALVHEAGFKAGLGPQISEWLRRSGAREVGAFDTDRLFQLK